MSLQSNGGGALKASDPQLYRILENEKNRQIQGLQLIASENFTSPSVREALSSTIMHKYSEGSPGNRYYSGNQFVDENETLCQVRALNAFHLDPDIWGVNVQALSGSPANFAVYTALLKPNDRLMGLKLSHGGHLSHGHSTSKQNVSATSKYFQSMPYQLDKTSGLIDYDGLSHLASLFLPKLIVAGASSYSRLFDYNRLRHIANNQNAILMADISHTAGLMATGIIPSAFDYADVVTSTTHKTLRGPRGALVFFRKKKGLLSSSGGDIEDKINSAIFPGLQGGPHNHTIAAISTALLEAKTESFHTYQLQVQKNAQILASTLIRLGYDIVSGGTDTHLMVIDLRSKGIDGARVSVVAQAANIYTNKNAIPDDTRSPMAPSGLRIGTPAMTTRGFLQEQFVTVAYLLDRVIQIACHWDEEFKSQSENGQTKLVDFELYCQKKQLDCPQIHALKEQVQNWCINYPIP